MNDLAECAGEIREPVPSHALATLARVEINTQIATAKQYPRSLKRFQQMALDMATLDRETAESCIYSLPRAGKRIEGPSVRLAEIIASAWGNLTYAGRIIEDDGRYVTAQGVCVDLERNVRASMEVKRRLVDKNGRRYSDDVVMQTYNAAVSIALRNAIEHVVPKAMWKGVYDRCKQIVMGDAKTLASGRAEALAYFASLGVSEKRVLAAVSKAGVEDVGLEDLAFLRGLATALKQGETTAEEAFPDQEKLAALDAAKSRTEQLVSKLDGTNRPGGSAAAGNGGAASRRQLSVIDALVNHLEAGQDDFLPWLHAEYGTDDPARLTYEQAEAVIAYLQGRLQPPPAQE